MEKVEIHLIGGWAYPEQCMHPLVSAMSGKATVMLYPFTVDVSSIRPSSSRWWLAGWSLGGMLAMEAVLDGKLKPEGLILISSTARFCAIGNGYPCGVPRSSLLLMIRGLPEARGKVLDGFFKLAGLKTHCEFSTDELLHGLQKLDAMDLRERLAGIHIPVLILHGTSDLIVPHAAGEFLASKIPGAKLVMQPGAGHKLPVEHAPWVAKQIQTAID